ncbi:MAG: hypothetical protein P9L99_07735 [Candidatus Lernaella stagnicola]|nr:hypothetical protein [Candidatus Lernaella stagnicola]
MRLLCLILPLCLLAAVAVAEPPPIAGFDAGKTFHFHIGDTFRVQLETEAGGRWTWPAIDETVVKRLGVETRNTGGKSVEITTFRAVGPGTIDLFAERVDAADPARVRARFPITVQVVEEPARP